MACAAYVLWGSPDVARNLLGMLPVDEQVALLGRLGSTDAVLHDITASDDAWRDIHRVRCVARRRGARRPCRCDRGEEAWRCVAAWYKARAQRMWGNRRRPREGAMRRALARYRSIRAEWEMFVTLMTPFSSAALASEPPPHREYPEHPAHCVASPTAELARRALGSRDAVASVLRALRLPDPNVTETHSALTRWGRSRRRQCRRRRQQKRGRPGASAATTGIATLTTDTKNASTCEGSLHKPPE